MTTAETKPFIPAALRGAVAPLGLGVGALGADALRCGVEHGLFVAIFVGVAALPVVLALLAFGAASAVLIVGLWKGPFPLRTFGVACTLAAVVAAAGGAAWIFHDSSPSFCRIDL